MLIILLSPVASNQVMAGLEPPAYAKAVHADSSSAGLVSEPVIENYLDRLVRAAVNQMISPGSLVKSKGLGNKGGGLDQPQHIPGQLQPSTFVPAPGQFRGQTAYLGTDQRHPAAVKKRSQIG